MPVRFRDIVKPDHYKKFRWQFFRMHFQFVMANEQPNAYDFFMIVCGPVPLTERMAVPAAALAVATGDAPAREWAWKQLENAHPGPVDAADFGELEPSGAAPGLDLIGSACAPAGGTFRLPRVGFGRSFGVKLGVLWAVEARLTAALSAAASTSNG